jgi:hypothetical protein
MVVNVVILIRVSLVVEGVRRRKVLSRNEHGEEEEKP